MLEVYRGKRVFLTGHTGFKGSWLCEVLLAAGAEVYGYALRPSTRPAPISVSPLETSVMWPLRVTLCCARAAGAKKTASKSAACRILRFVRFTS